MSKLETIPAEEGATLLPQKPKTAGIRRVVAAAALASFVIGVLAATAVQTSPGRHASNLHSKHEHETTEVDDEGPHKYYWDDAISASLRDSRASLSVPRRMTSRTTASKRKRASGSAPPTRTAPRSGRSSTSAACARTGATTPTWSATAHRGPINRSRSRPPTSA